MNDVEETLRRTLGSAARNAPRMPADLPTQLETGYRRRRRHNLTQAVLAAAAVLVLAGGTAAVLPRGDMTAAVPTPTVSAWPLPEPVEKVWPEAVRKVPARGPGGTTLRPQAFIDDQTVLVATWGGFEKTNTLYAYDLGTHDLRKITHIPTPAGTVTFASDFTLGDGLVAWWTATKNGQAHLWTAPLSGGEPTRIASTAAGDADGAALDRLAVEGGQIVFSLFRGGVFTVPAAGGAVRAVPGGAGLHLLKWPWIGSPGAADTADGTQFTSITNVQTRETDVAVTHPGESSVVCDVRLCTGLRKGGKNFYRLRDGSEEKGLPSDALMLFGLTRDRFLVSPVTAEGAGLVPVLYDVSTGRAADLGGRSAAGGLQVPAVARDDRLLSYQLKDDLYVIDLEKIT